MDKLLGMIAIVYCLVRLAQHLGLLTPPPPEPPRKTGLWAWINRHPILTLMLIGGALGDHSEHRHEHHEHYDREGRCDDLP
jgi:hypothetical protein